jgi:HK97 gp10 family phage protein
MGCGARERHHNYKILKPTIKIEGLDELQAIFKELPAVVSYNLIIKGLKRSGSIIQQEARSLAPVDSGDLKRGIVSAPKRDRKNPTVFVGPRRGKTGPWYAHFQEFGTSGFGKRTRKYVGRIDGVRKFKTTKYARVGGGLPAQPFMQPAFDRKYKIAYDSIKENIGVEVYKFLKRKAPQYYS